MKVVLYANSFFPNVGGGERYNLDLAEQLFREGIKVFVITPVENTNPDIFHFSVFRLKRGIFHQIIQIIKIIKIISPDIVHLSGPTQIDYIIALFLRLEKIPVVMTYHADFPSLLGRIYNSLIGIFQRSFDRIMVQSTSDYLKLINRGVDRKKIVSLLFNGVDEDIYKITNTSRPRDIDIIFIGRMDKAHSYKGYWELLKILEALSLIGGCHVKSLIVGGGDDFGGFEKMANSKNLNIVTQKDVSEQDLVSLLNRSRFIILPSISNSEGFGRVIVEGMYCGTIPIVSKFAGVSELVKKYDCGIAIDPTNIRDASDVIYHLLQDEAIVSKLEKNLKMLIQEGIVSLKGTIQNTLEIYSEILEKK